MDNLKAARQILPRLERMSIHLVVFTSVAVGCAFTAALLAGLKLF
jgi:hypothetical protein